MEKSHTHANDQPEEAAVDLANEAVNEEPQPEVPPLMFSTLMRVFCADFAAEKE